MYAHTNTVLLKMLLQAFGTEAFARALMGSENLRFQSCFLPCPFRGRAFAPCVITADRNTQQPAHRWHRVILSHLFNHAVLHRDSLAKYVANFFNRSRSIFTSASSRCTRASSASSSVSGFWSLPTYIATDEGWLYLAGLKDLYSGEMVGYAMSERMTKDLVMQALFRAVSIRRPKPGLIQHTDSGSQYCAQAYQKLLRQFGMRASMSRRGNCYDNAPIESFWGSLKSELIYHQRFATREQARLAIAEYIEMFYNRQRTQARLNYLSPAAFTRRFYLGRTAA